MTLVDSNAFAQTSQSAETTGAHDSISGLTIRLIALGATLMFWIVFAAAVYFMWAQ